MYNPIDKGSIIEIPDNAFGFNFKCHVPPVGYGINSSSGLILKTDVLERKDDEIEQYWERPRLPYDFQEKRKKEKIIQRIDRNYVDPYLEEIRRTEWKRRMNGVWFYNWNPIIEELEPIYLTGVNYMYITHWKFQGKYNDYRVTDRDLWYVRSYCDFDQYCLGLNEITKRKNGKTARSGCWLYERTSRMNNHHAGIQSKTDDDGWGVFKKAIVQPWKTLPDFFRPRYDTMKGDDPNDELRLFATSRRGSKTEEEDENYEEPLDSWIDFRPSGESGYDGDEVHSYISDETGKTKNQVSVIERQNTVRFASEIEGVFGTNKHWSTTTVEPEKNETENYEFYDLTADSNPLSRDENGRTGTGYYTYFLPAQLGFYSFNEKYKKYGFPDEAKAHEYLNNTIAKYESEGKSRKVSSFKRKNPRTFKEAFSADGENALYDPTLINDQLDGISWGELPTEFGNLKWKDGFEFERPAVVQPNGDIEYVLNELYWEEDPKGLFEKVKGWWPKIANSIYKNGDNFLPNNNFAHRIGCDPFKYDKTKDKRRSQCAAFGYQIADPLYPDDIYNDMFTIKYAYRANGTKESDMDVLKLSWLMGCQVLFERNVNHWKDNFATWKCSAFLMWLPGEVEPGIYTDGTGNVVQMICNYTEAYINKFIKKVFFKSLMRKVTGWLDFKVEETQKFDEPMAAGFTLVAVHGKKYSRPTDHKKDIENYMPYRKAG